MVQMNILSIDNQLRRQPSPQKKRKTLPPRHRFLEPIHNVKEGASLPFSGQQPENPRLHPWSGGASRDRTDDLKLAKLALSQLSYGPVRSFQPLPTFGRSPASGVWRKIISQMIFYAKLVGREGVEPSTSRLSGVRSNHLSYRPMPLLSLRRRRRLPPAWLPRISSGARSRLRPVAEARC